MADPVERRHETTTVAQSVRKQLQARTPESLGRDLRAFGLLNYPLPG